MATITLANESAMGTCVFSWTSPSTGIRAKVMWGPGMTPMVSWTSPGLAGRPPGPRQVAREIVNPARFGWSDPSAQSGKKQAAAVRALALAYAAALETALAEEDE